METFEKIKKINSLKNEVKELHPFLADLFSVLPKISHVEYTHGNQEYGADFILVKHDETLDQEIYIGVVVKSTDIKQNNFDEIQRQSDEAFMMPKQVFNGKRNVTIDTVWIVTSQTVSHNAQEKIGIYLKCKSVRFIDSTEIVKLVDNHYCTYWTDINLSISHYFELEKTKIEEKEKQDNLVKSVVAPFYIEPEIFRIRKHDFSYDKRSRPIEKIDIYNFIEKEKFTIIEAPMGYGKSKLLREIVKHYLDCETFLKKRTITVLTNYSQLFSKSGEFDPNLLYSIFNTEKIDSSLYEKVIFLVDAFDEVTEDIDEKLKNIDLLDKSIQERKNYSIVLATRGMKGFSEHDFADTSIKKVEIQSLSLKKIIQFLEKLCSALDIKDRIIEDIKKAPLLKELPQSPIAAILLAKLFESNTKDLPANLPELYTMYCELALGRWDVEKNIESTKEFSLASSVMFQISYYFIDNQCDVMTYAEYQSILNKYLSKRNFDEFYQRVDYILTERSCILGKNERNNTVFYSHRSFIEYFYAKGKSQGSGLLVDKRVFNIYWNNIYYFYVGIKKDCQDLLVQITDVIPETEPEKWLKIINLPNFYLAAITTPYEFFEGYFYKILIETAQLYKCITVSEQSVIFSDLPRLVILWWIQYIIKESYSYEHFRNCIVDSTIRIEDAEIEEDIKMYALFFISSIGLRLKEYEPIKILIRNYKDILPEDITIGISNEIRIEEAYDAQLQTAQKWLDKKVKRMHPNLIKQLSRDPIKYSNPKKSD